MKTKIALLLITAVFLLPNNTNAIPPCSCGNVQYLKLQHPNMVSKDVEEIQSQLRNIGYYDGPINGVYDENTVKSVKDFQSAEALSVDGIFGPKSFDRLAEIFEQPAANIGTEKPQGKVALVIFALERKLVVLDGDEPFKEFPIAVGKFNTPTPIGLFTITQKDAWGEGFGSRWMRLSVPWGIYGIHGYSTSLGVSGLLNPAGVYECTTPMLSKYMNG